VIDSGIVPQIFETKIEFSQFKKRDHHLTKLLRDVLSPELLHSNKLRKLLEADPNFGGWLKNPGYPYSKPNNPTLTLDVTKGELVYKCPKITDGMKDGSFQVNDLVLGIHASGAEEC
jgi:hypothetical protein